MEIIEKIIIQLNEPAILRNTAWLEPVSKKLYIYLNGKWELITEEAEVAELWKAIALLETGKADTSGIYEELTAGNLLGRSTDAILVSNASFVHRTSGGSASISDGEAALLTVQGNINLTTGEAFKADELQSVGFNLFNPNNTEGQINQVITGYGISGTSLVPAAGHSVIIVRVVACDASAEAGYEVTYKEETTPHVAATALYFTKYPTTTDPTSLTGGSALTASAHRNSTSYLPTSAGYVVWDVTTVDASKLAEICVHICWSGYNDGKYEAYTLSTPVQIPFATKLHSWGMGATGDASDATAVRDSIDYRSDNTVHITKRVERRTLTDLEWVSDSEDIVTLVYDDNQCATTPTKTLVLKMGSGDNMSLKLSDYEVGVHEYYVYKGETEEGSEIFKWEDSYYPEGSELPALRGVVYTTVDNTQIIDTYKHYYKTTTLAQGNEDIEPNGKFAICVLASAVKNRISLSNTTLNYWNTSTAGIGTDLDNGIIYYELETYQQGYQAVSTYKYLVSDFGTEFFTYNKHILAVNAYGVNTQYVPFLLDSIRGLLQRLLQDRVPINYVVELTATPSTAYTFTSPLTKANTVFHWYDSVNTTDHWYKYDSGTTYLTIDGMEANVHYIWEKPFGTTAGSEVNVTSTSLSFAALNSSDALYRNEYSFEFKVSSTLGSELSLNFPYYLGSGQTKPILWNSTPDVKKPGSGTTTYEFSIDPSNCIGLWCAGKESDTAE